MAYQHDSDGPHADKGVLIAKIIAYFATAAAILIISKIAINAMWGKDDSLDVVKIAIEAEFLKQNIINYQIKADTNTIDVSYWEEGMVTITKNAFQGDDDAVKRWNLQKEQMQNMASVVNDKKYLFDNVDDIVVVFKLVNENNHARALLTYKNSQLVYDVVRDTKGE